MAHRYIIAINDKKNELGEMVITVNISIACDVKYSIEIINQWHFVKKYIGLKFVSKKNAYKLHSERNCRKFSVLNYKSIIHA